MEKFSLRSTNEMINEALEVIHEYYDAEYVYYIEKIDNEVESISEWCAPEMPWQRETVKNAEPEQQPRWLRQEITDPTAESYSVFQHRADGITAVLAAVTVRREGVDTTLLRALLPQISQNLVLHKDMKFQEYLSNHDEQTGLLNRNSFVGYLAEVNEEKLLSLGVLAVDINGLRNFNKEFGREYGDEVIKRVAEVLEDFFKKGDMIFRFTGDEYIVISENTSYEDFLRKIHLSHEYIENISQGLVTIGYTWEKTNIDVGKLVNDAENMMLEEKNKYYKNMQKKRHEPIIKEDLLEDIKQGNYIVALIPKFEVSSDTVVGAEAVVRYHHKDLGTIDPGKYLTLLEETRLSAYLDLYIFEEICKTLQRWENDGLHMVPVAVNFAGSTLRQENIAGKMMELIEKYQVSCEYLAIEVTESNVEMNQEMLAETSNKMRKYNIRVILDHFGAKNSSFSILSTMEFDGLKLDAGLITDIVGGHRSQTVVQAVIDICHQLGSTVTADGLETQDQLNVLNELGCDYAQGTYYNKAIAIDTFEVRYLNDY